MKTKGIKSVVSEFNNIYFGNWARIFFDKEKNEIWMLEYVDCNSGPCNLPKNITEIAHLARRNGKITMRYVQDCLNEAR